MKRISLSLLAFLIVRMAPGQFIYPLQVGNRWQYKEPPPPEEPYIYEDRVVGDTLMPNGHTYSTINVAGGSEFHYYRQQGQSVFEFLTVGDTLYRNKEILRFDFSKGLYDTISVFQISPRDTVVIAVVDTGKISVFGILRPFKTFMWTQRGGAFYRANRIVDSLGTTFYQIEPGYQLYLSGAVLNGLTYGNVVSVRENGNGLASGYLLLQNYPNPFNPTTTITFRFGRREYGKLAVYDINGRLVKTLLSGELDTGYHSVIWDGTTDRGGPASAGVYVYSLEVGASAKLSRMMLLLH